MQLVAPNATEAREKGEEGGREGRTSEKALGVAGQPYAQIPGSQFFLLRR